jgi:hypothetical protein
VLLALREVGFTGPIVDDHATPMVGDSGWSFRTRAYQAGYLQGLLRAVDDLVATHGAPAGRPSPS